MTQVLIGVVLGVALIGGWSLYAMSQPQTPCPGCGEKLPHRAPKSNLRQVMFGGWTCPSCGTEVDRHGQKVG